MLGGEKSVIAAVSSSSSSLLSSSSDLTIVDLGGGADSGNERRGRRQGFALPKWRRKERRRKKKNPLVQISDSPLPPPLPRLSGRRKKTTDMSFVVWNEQRPRPSRREKALQVPNKVRR